MEKATYFFINREVNLATLNNVFKLYIKIG
jgi:hypothetical protein